MLQPGSWGSSASEWSRWTQRASGDTHTHAHARTHAHSLISYVVLVVIADFPVLVGLPCALTVWHLLLVSSHSSSLPSLCPALPSLPCCRHLPSPQVTLEVMLSSKVTSLPGHIQAVFVQNVVKLYASILVTAEAQVGHRLAVLVLTA